MVMTPAQYKEFFKTGYAPGVALPGVGAAKRDVEITLSPDAVAAQNDPNMGYIKKQPTKTFNAHPEFMGKTAKEAAAAAIAAAAIGGTAAGFGVYGLEEVKKGGQKTMSTALDILNPLHDLASGITDVQEWLGWNAGDFTPETHGGVGHRWTANGAEFQMNDDGTITVKRKDGSYKTYKPYKPLVFGKKLKVNAYLRLSKKYEKEWKELDKIFKKRSRTRRK